MRYLAILKDLFDSGQMPEHGQAILQGEADGVPLVELAAELGIGASVARGRLFRMRARFRARLAARGMQETAAFGKSSSPVKRNAPVPLKGDGRSDARARARRSLAQTVLSPDDEEALRVEERRFESKKSLFE